MRMQLDLGMQCVKEMSIALHSMFVQDDYFDHVGRGLPGRDLVNVHDPTLNSRRNRSSLIIHLGDAEAHAGMLRIGQRRVHNPIKHKTPVTCATGAREILVAGARFVPG